jgi:hypothetical protein
VERRKGAAGRKDPHCAISAPIVLPQVKVKMTRCEGGEGGLACYAR